MSDQLAIDGTLPPPDPSETEIRRLMALRIRREAIRNATHAAYFAARAHALRGADLDRLEEAELLDRAHVDAARIAEEAARRIT